MLEQTTKSHKTTEENTLAHKQKLEYFKHRSLSDLYRDLITEQCAFLLPYPSTASWSSYPNNSQYVIHDPPDVEKEISQSTVHIKEAHRHLAVLGNSIPGIVTELPHQEIVMYWRHQFGHNYDNIIHYPQNTYCTDINSADWQSLFTLFPHDHIISDKHFVAPDKHYHLLDKASLEHFNVPIPRQSIVDISRGVKENMFPSVFPYLIKVRWGLSGDGTYIVQNKNDLQEAITEFSLYHKNSSVNSLIIQEYIHAKNNYNVQFYIGRDGKVSLLGMAKQITGKHGSWLGGISELNSDMKDFLSFITETVKYAYDQGYCGVTGLDILEDKEGAMYLIDANFRLNGTTPLYILRNQLISQRLLVSSFLSTLSFQGDIKNMLSQLKKPLDKQELVILSAHQKQKRTEIYGIISASDYGTLEENKLSLQKLGLSL